MTRCWSSKCQRGRAVLIALLLAAPRAQAVDGEVLSLTDAIQRALTHNRTVLSARFNAQSTEFDIVQQEAAFDFRLSPQTTATSGENADTLGYGLSVARKISWGTDISAGANVTRSTYDTTEPITTSRLSVRVDQPLFRESGKLVQLEPIRAAESRYQQSLRLLESTKADVVLAVVERYQDVLRLEQLLAADHQRVQRLAKLQRLTTLREKQGRATRLDTMRVELQVGQAQTSLEGHHAQLDASRRALADLLGEPPERAHTLATPPRLDLELPAPELATATALSNRLDYAQAMQDVVDARRGERIARKRLWPSLKLSTGVEQGGTGRGLSEATDLGDTVWFFGLSGDSDLFRRRDQAGYASAAVATSATLLNGEIVRDQIAREVYDALSAYRRDVQELEIAERNFDVAGRRLKLADRLFRMGRTDNISVTDAEESFLLAQNDASAASAEASVAGYRVLRTMGTLIETPDELKAPQPL